MQRGHLGSSDRHPSIATELCIYFTSIFFSPSTFTDGNYCLTMSDISEAEAVYSYYFNYLTATNYTKTSLLSILSIFFCIVVCFEINYVLDPCWEVIN